MQIARGVVLEGLLGRGFTLGDRDQLGQARDPLALEPAANGGAGGRGIDVGTGDRDQVVEGQQHGAAPFHDQEFLGPTQGRRHSVGSVGGILHVLPTPPLTHRAEVEVQFPR